MGGRREGTIRPPFCADGSCGYSDHPDCDVGLDHEVDVEKWCAQVAETTSGIYSHRIQSAVHESAMIDFQLARGPTGVSV